MPRAVRFDEYGGVDVLHVDDVPAPHPGPGQVVVAVRAAGTNPGEASIRSGAMHELFPATFPSGQGSDLAGVVSEVGSGVQGLAVGEEVLGWTDERASQAELVVVPAGQLARKPPELPWEVAGALYVAGNTALVAVETVRAGEGDVVAVSAAAGGVGAIASQLARIRGARVLGIASAANADWLRSHGITPVERGDGLADRLREAAPDGIDAFIDCFGQGYVQLALDLGVDRDRVETIIDFAAAQQLGVHAEGGHGHGTPERMAELARLVVAGELEVPIAATYPLEQVREAYTELERRRTRGKIVLVP